MKRLCVVILCILLGVTMTGCKKDKGEELYQRLNSKDIPTTTSVISVADYLDKVKGALVGQMIGVTYAYPAEFEYKTWVADANLPTWSKERINGAFDQDDIYLALSGIEALDKYGLDVTSTNLAIDMYNRDFEYWNGSNNDVLARGYAPAYSGYPKYSTDGDLTTWFPDGNSYQCGGALGGMIGLNMAQFTNDISQRFAEICTYGDGIYGMQFIGAMYGAAFFTSDVRQIVEAGLKVIPADSWSALVIDDVLANFDEGMSAQDNFNFLDQKYIQSPEYNWIPWPYNGILLDAKMCSAFTVIGLLYGEKDLQETIKYAIRCANDTDSTATAAAGILCTILGFNSLSADWVSDIKPDIQFKYTRLTIDKAVETSRKVLEAAIIKNGGQIAYVDDVLSYLIPQEAKQVTVGQYQNSKYPNPMEKKLLTEDEKKRMRILSDPGFERLTGDLTHGWSTSSKFQTKLEYMKGNAYTGMNDILIKSSTKWQDLFYRMDVNPHTNYEISCMVRTNPEFASKVQLFCTSDVNVNIRTVEFTNLGEWTKISMTVNTGDLDIIRLGVGFTGTNTADWLRVDDFELFVK